MSHKKLTWDKSLIHNDISSSNDKKSVSNENPNSTLKEKIKRTEPKTSANNVNLSICGDCTMQEAMNEEVKQPVTCKYCTVAFENLTQPSRLLLHWHKKLDHMGFDAIRALASKGFLPKCIARANAVKCAACQARKQIKKPASRKGKIIGDTVTNLVT